MCFLTIVENLGCFLRITEGVFAWMILDDGFEMNELIPLNTNCLQMLMTVMMMKNQNSANFKMTITQPFFLQIRKFHKLFYCNNGAIEMT